VAIHDFYKKMISLRHEYPALRTGLFTTVFAEGKIYAYLRQDQNNRILIVINNESSARTISIDMKRFEIGTLFEDRITDMVVEVKNGNLEYHLKGLTGAVLVEKHKN